MILMLSLLALRPAPDLRAVEDDRQYWGKIALIDTKGRKMAIDVREREGAKVGDRLQVTREGKKVGVLVITEVKAWGSWATQEGDADFDVFQKGDPFELLTK